jgi:hypothetical protein
MPEIDFGLLQPVDVGALTQQGFATGVALVRHVQTQHALSNYLANPDNPQAYNALAAFDPNAAATIQNQQLVRHKLALEADQEHRRHVAGTQAAAGDVQGGMATSLAGGDLDFAEALSKLDDLQKKQLSDMYKGAAPFAYQALKMPYEQRKAYIQQISPQLEAAGWTPDKIAAFDPTDGALGGIVQGNMTLDQAMARDKIDYREVLNGARLVPFDATGRPVTSDSGGDTPSGKPVTAAPADVVSTLSSALPAPVVAGFLGNLHVEGGYGGAKGDGGTAAGIAQWHGDRQANFERVIGKPVSQATPGEQAKFIVWEMQNPQAAGMTVAQRDQILAAKTPAEAAALIDQHYERSSGAHRHLRIDAANQYYGGGSIRQHAEEAIAAGADPEQVKARAAAMGVSL